MNTGVHISVINMCLNENVEDVSLNPESSNSVMVYNLLHWIDIKITRDRKIKCINNEGRISIMIIF